MASKLNTLRTILSNVVAQVGRSKSLPEMRISEFIAPKPAHASEQSYNYNVPLNPQGMSKIGSNYPFYSGDTSGNVGGKVGGGNTGGGNVGGNVGIGDNGGFSDANSEYDRKKASIMSKLQLMKDEAQRLRGSAKGQFDFTTGEVGRNYGALKNLNTEKLNQSLNTLTGEDTNVQNIYGRLGGNTRRAMESALSRNRVLNRAMGSLGSSFYSNSQGDTTNTGMTAINDAGSELAAKRAAIEGQKSATTTDFGQNEVAIGAEENSLKNKALLEYNNAVANADLLEKNYNIDSVEAIDEADNKLASSLQAIRDYVTDKSIATQASGASSGIYGNFVKNYNAKSPIESTLNTNDAVNSANKFIAGANTPSLNNIASSANNAISQYNPNDPNFWINKNKKKTQTDPNQYFVNA